MKNTKHNPTMMIKSAFSNKIHKLLGVCTHYKTTSREYWACLNERKKLTDEDKVKLFDEVMRIYKETSDEIKNYRKNRNLKKWVNRGRENRGYVPKKKTSKEEYLKMVEDMKEVS
jgi:ClpP class serine protease